MTTRCFDTGDAVTDYNLSRLDHLATNDSFEGDERSLHNWLVAVIQSIQMLPKAVAVKFNLYDYAVGDRAYNASPERRAQMWRDMVRKLNEQIDRVIDDESLQRQGPNGPPDLADRRPSRGERIKVLCDKLEAARGTTEFEAVLSNVEREASSGIRADVAELRRLSRKKRITDLSDHQYWIQRHIEHIRIIADEMHHLE